MKTPEQYKALMEEVSKRVQTQFPTSCYSGGKIKIIQKKDKDGNVIKEGIQLEITANDFGETISLNTIDENELADLDKVAVLTAKYIDSSLLSRYSAKFTQKVLQNIDRLNKDWRNQYKLHINTSLAYSEIGYIFTLTNKTNAAEIKIPYILPLVNSVAPGSLVMQLVLVILKAIEPSR